MGRHRGSEVPATPRQRRAAELLGVAIGLGLVATVAGVVGFGINVAPSVQADELPQLPEVSEPATPVAGPVRPIFDFADVTPWDPGKEPTGEDSSTAVRNVGAGTPARPSAARERVVVVGPVPQVPPNHPAPTQGDPLHDDGTFGDGCEQPGTPERCDPDVPPVGLPPVVVPSVEDETEPAKETPPAEEETPVDKVEVVEPVTEVAGL